MNNYINVGKNLKKIRENKGFSLLSIGRFIDKSEEDIKNFELGILPIPSDILEILSILYNCSIEKILETNITEEANEEKDYSLAEMQIFYDFGKILRYIDFIKEKSNF